MISGWQFYIPENSAPRALCFLCQPFFGVSTKTIWEHSKYQIEQKLKRQTKTKKYLHRVKQLLLRTISDANPKQFQEIHVIYVLLKYLGPQNLEFSGSKSIISRAGRFGLPHTWKQPANTAKQHGSPLQNFNSLEVPLFPSHIAQEIPHLIRHV